RGLDDDDILHATLQQPVGGGEAREARADDADVGIDAAGQGGALRRRAGARGVVVLHNRGKTLQRGRRRSKRRVQARTADSSTNSPQAQTAYGMPTRFTAASAQDARAMKTPGKALSRCRPVTMRAARVWSHENSLT